MQDRDVHAAQSEARRCLQSQQASTNHHRIGARLTRRRDHRFGVIEVAVSDDARQFTPLNRDNEGGGTGCDDQLVIRHFSRLADDNLAVAVDLDDVFAEPARHLVGAIPGLVVGDDFSVALFAGEDRRQHDPIVIPPSFGIEKCDLIGLGVGFEQVLQRTARGHASTDDDKLFHLNLLRHSGR